MGRQYLGMVWRWSFYAHTRVMVYPLIPIALIRVLYCLAGRLATSAGWK